MTDYLYGRTWLFHPSGAKVEIALPSNYAEEAFTFVNECLNAGFLASAPDLSGLDRLDVAYVVRGQVTNERGTTPRLYFYAAWAQQSSNMTVYLNTPDEIAKFERVSGLAIDNLPLIKGKTPPQRDSMDFEHMATPVNFTVTRRKIEDSGSPVGYRWELVDYISAGTPPRPAPPPPSPSGNSGNGTPSSPDYEAETLNWLAENGVTFAEFKLRLSLKDKDLPAKTDKAAWGALARRYATLPK